MKLLKRTQRQLSEIYGNFNPEFNKKWLWLSEKILSDGDSIAASLTDLIKNAQSSIELETYIYQDDSYGRQIEKLLIDASQRGVTVRVSVDGVGSRGWIFYTGKRLHAAGVKVRVYNQLIWERLFSNDLLEGKSAPILKLLTLINRRDHRKVCIADGQKACICSSNIWQASVPQIAGDRGWKETGIEVQGEGVKILQAAFNLIWHPRLTADNAERKHANNLIKQAPKSLVRLNNTIRLRTLAYHSLLNRIRCAKNRIWITNPYFVPTSLLVTELSEAVKRGVDVRIVTSDKSDIVFMPWVSASYQEVLSANNVKLFAYFKSILHAKYVIIDKLAIIGSSNINRRSLHHDLEADIMTETPATVEELARLFTNDLIFCRQLKPDDYSRRPFWQKIAGRFLLFFRNYL